MTPSAVNQALKPDNMKRLREAVARGDVGAKRAMIRCPHLSAVRLDSRRGCGQCVGDHGCEPAQLLTALPWRPRCCCRMSALQLPPRRITLDQYSIQYMCSSSLALCRAVPLGGNHN